MKTLRYVCFVLLSMVLSFGMVSCNDDIKDLELEGEAIAVTTANVAHSWKYTYYDYNTVANTSVIMDLKADGSMTTTYYDVNGDVIVELDGSKAIVTGSWSLNGQTLTVTDGEGNVSRCTVQKVTEKYLYVVLPKDETTGLSNQLMKYERVN